MVDEIMGMGGVDCDREVINNFIDVELRLDFKIGSRYG